MRSLIVRVCASTIFKSNRADKMISKLFRRLFSRRPRVESLPALSDEPLPKIPEAHEVFCPGGTPTFTLVDRLMGDPESAQKISNIIFDLRRRATIISLNGESKSGKTILCLQALKNRRPIEVHASQAKSTTEFWATILSRLNLPTAITVKNEDRDSLKLGNEVEANVEMNGMIIGRAALKAKAAVEGGVERETSEVREFSLAGKTALTDALIEADRPIVIDDFHWIDSEDVQREILRDLRPFIQRNGSVVVISVPDKAGQILSHDVEMSRLCKSLKVPDWDFDQVVAIGRDGFEALNAEIDDTTLRKLARFSHSNPMLMQENCLGVCRRAKIHRREHTRRQSTLDDNDLREIFIETAKSRSHQSYQEFTASSRESWTTARGHRINIYTLLLLAMRHIQFEQEIGRDRLAERIAEIIGPNKEIPNKTVITNALVKLSIEMKGKLKDSVPIEYDQSTHRVYFLDPFFMAYIQWVLAPVAGEPTPF